MLGLSGEILRGVARELVEQFGAQLAALGLIGLSVGGAGVLGWMLQGTLGSILGVSGALLGVIWAVEHLEIENLEGWRTPGREE